MQRLVPPQYDQQKADPAASPACAFLWLQSIVMTRSFCLRVFAVPFGAAGGLSRANLPIFLNSIGCVLYAE